MVVSLVFKEFKEKIITYIMSLSSFGMVENLRIKLVKIYKDTLTNSPIYNQKPKLIDSIDIPEVSRQTSNCKIEVVNTDTLLLADTAVNNKYNPLVLCFADDHLPGGFVTSGARAQEEEIWRRTNICKSLNEEFYPLTKTNMILSPKVTVFKDTSYNIIDPFVVDILSIAALRTPERKDDKYLFDDDYKVMYNKIDSIFRVAIFNKNDSLILGAFGCGSFSNPVREVVNIFREMITKYSGSFSYIGFAIIDKTVCGEFTFS